MSKAALADAVVASAGTTRKQAERAVDAAFAAIGTSLVETGAFRIPGFGTFSVRDFSERSARNPHTGETVNVPGGRRVFFKAALRLTRAVSPTVRAGGERGD